MVNRALCKLPFRSPFFAIWCGSAESPVATQGLQELPIGPQEKNVETVTQTSIISEPASHATCFQLLSVAFNQQSQTLKGLEGLRMGGWSWKMYLS